MKDHPLKVFGGTGNGQLAQSICKYLKIPLGAAKIERFPDGERFIKLEDDVRGRDCFVVQPTCSPVDDNLMELLIYLDCLRRASAARITAVIPYFGYARQDRKDEGRVPVTAKLVANLISTAGADRILAIDLHAKQIQGFFDIPVDHLTAGPVLVKYFKGRGLTDLTVVAPDVGNMKTAAQYASALGGELAIIHKRRVSGSEVRCDEIIGTIEGKNIVMCDDMITTAGTVCGAAKLLKDRGAGMILAGATHGVLAGEAVRRIQASPIDEVIVTDTVPLNDKSASLENIKVLTVSELLGEAINRIHNNESVSIMFEED
ncbi:MAG TPA: ribose-phosphate pyrophosphokinase [Planctomycetes bacterium]|nr:ribose-phosphate pyrophosphokinase [Planctomycetota bacterium]HIJ71250.1 ribose-phosphate pyrophosphokinase [Planctomycetota bacterium]